MVGLRKWHCCGGWRARVRPPIRKGFLKRRPIRRRTRAQATTAADPARRTGRQHPLQFVGVMYLLTL
jgi:hypothetical protein